MSMPILRWTFRRNTSTLTCEIDAVEKGFSVSIVPHWDLRATVVEHYDATMSALERHADIALRLRDAGWDVTERAAA
jgi:hypothetical protein